MARRWTCASRPNLPPNLSAKDSSMGITVWNREVIGDADGSGARFVKLRLHHQNLGVDDTSAALTMTQHKTLRENAASATDFETKAASYLGSWWTGKAQAHRDAWR